MHGYKYDQSTASNFTLLTVLWGIQRSEWNNGVIITAELWIVGNGNLEEWSLGGILNTKSARVKLSEISRKCPKKKERKESILGTGALFEKAESRECLEKGLTMSREWWEVQWRRRSQGWYLGFWVRKTFGWWVHLLRIEKRGRSRSNILGLETDVDKFSFGYVELE